MKKFMYAALFLGALSSCSDDRIDDVNNGNGDVTNEETGLAPIRLSLQNGNYNVKTRGQGMVGGIQGNPTANEWNNETLYIVMTDSGTVDYVEPDYEYAGSTDYVLANVAVSALSGNDTTYVVGADQLTGHYYYYPTVGMFDFYGYHVDDACVSPDPQKDTNEKNLTLSIDIDGSQDLMSAKADYKKDSANYAANTLSWYPKSYKYGTYVARRNVQPTLTFNHLLTQLQFKVKNAGSSNVEMWVDSVGVYSYHKADWIVAGETYQSDNAAQWIPNVLTWETTDKDTLYVKNDYNNDSKQDSLQKVALFTTDGNVNTINPDFVEIGHLLVPATNHQGIIQEYKGRVVLVQKLRVSDADPAYNDEGNWVEMIDTVEFTIKLPTDQVNGFQAGHAYTVNISVYGLSMIEVTAELTEWKNGGDFYLSPEDQENTGEDAEFVPGVNVLNSLYVSDEASFNLLPESYRSTHSFVSIGDLPWLAVIFEPIEVDHFDILVEGPNNFSKVLNWTFSKNEYQLVTINAAELGLNELTAGDWIVTFNGSKNTITVPSPSN